MTPVWNEDEVSIDVLSEHLSNSGYVIKRIEENRIDCLPMRVSAILFRFWIRLNSFA